MRTLHAALTDFGLKVNSIKYNKNVRVPTVDKPRKKNGWYFTDGTFAAFGDWATGEKGYWREKNADTSYKTRAEKQARYAQLKARRTEEERQSKEKALAEINKTWLRLNQAAKATEYLIRKKALLQPDFKIDFLGKLAIPMFNIDNKLTGYQLIATDGSKLFKTGSQLKGNFYPIKPQSLTLADLDLLILCEGYATGSSIYQALNEEFDAINYGIICCFSASNIDVVASSILNKFSKKSIFLIADNDEVGLKSNLLKFSVGFTKGQDANDVHCEFSLEVLTEVITHHIKEYITRR